MIKKLRRKLIFVSMVSLFVVLFLVMGGIGLLNYRNTVADADSILEILKENGGKFPDMKHSKEKKGERPEQERGNPLMSPELPYETRYFSVRLDNDGTVLTVDTGKTASVDSSTAVEYAERIWKKDRERGFLGDYRFLSYDSGGETCILFLDWSRNLNTFRSFVLTGIGVSVSGFLAVLFLMLLLSARIVKPFLESYEKQKRFITDAGHELKTPLTIIDADTEVLGMDQGENEWLEDIQTQTRRLADLTNSLITLARMEEEASKENMLEFLLSDVAEEAVGAFQALARTQDKDLSWEIAPMIAMKGDEAAIRRLITILLDNAVKYSNAGGKISLSLEKQKNRIRLSVYNTTEAIEKEQLEHLFDRFYRTDRSRNSQTGGYGIGLSIAAATVNMHRGKITAETEDGRSLRITATFPA